MTSPHNWRGRVSVSQLAVGRGSGEVSKAPEAGLRGPVDTEEGLLAWLFQPELPFFGPEARGQKGAQCCSQEHEGSPCHTQSPQGPSLLPKGQQKCHPQGNDI